MLRVKVFVRGQKKKNSCLLVYVSSLTWKRNEFHCQPRLAIGSDNLLEATGAG